MAATKAIRNGVLGGGWRGISAKGLLIAASWVGVASVAQAAPPNTMPIWRLQVRLLTSGVDDANTDDWVRVQLNGSNQTWLDSGRNDHERNSDETFDLRTDGITTLADLDFFRLEKKGTDGWAIRQLQLLVNGVAIYVHDFPSTPLWIDGDDGGAPVFLNDDYFLRQRSEWINYAVPTRSSVVPVRAMERRLEALVGDWKYDSSGTNFIGGDRGVELFTKTTNTWRVDLDLEDEKQWPYPDLEFDVDFDLTVACNGGRPAFSVTNVNTDVGWPESDGGSVSFVRWNLAPRLDDMMKNYTFTWCPTIVLASNGDLHFNRRIPPWGDLPIFDLVDTLAPIGLRVTTGGPIKTDSKASFVATVKSTLKQDEKVEFGFYLPPQVALLEPVIEVQTVKDSYRIEVKAEQRDDGSTSVVFSDALRAGALAHYTLPLIYKPGKESGQIKTWIQPLGDETAATVTALEAVTWFEFGPDLVVPVVTSVAQSRYVDDPKEEPIK
ncbi:MAG TPA: hypothetical protein VFZ61_25775 [Polyangiales bacterium]